MTSLWASGLLDSGPEESFDRFTRLASRLLDAPAAFVSLVTPDRQYLKSTVGLPTSLAEARETSLDRCLCKHAVERREPVAFPDLSEEPVPEARAAVGEFGLGSYLRAPLITGGGATAWAAWP